LREAHPLIAEAGAGLVIVGTGAAYQAQRLMDDGYPAECLVDPAADLYTTLGIGRIGPQEWLKPTVIRRYVQGWRAGGRQGRVTGDWRRLSGVALIAPDRTLRYLHRSDSVGDYPSVATILAALAA
jgi:hypothetical protein